MASPATPLMDRNKATVKAFHRSDCVKDREISGRRIEELRQQERLDG